MVIRGRPGLQLTQYRDIVKHPVRTRPIVTRPNDDAKMTSTWQSKHRKNTKLRNLGR